MVRDVVAPAAREPALESISLDLIFGVPGQTPASWRAHRCERAIELDVDHISTYGLTVEEGTPYAQWQAREPGAFFDDTREAELYRIGNRRAGRRRLRTLRDQQLRASRPPLPAQRELLGQWRVCGARASAPRRISAASAAATFVAGTVYRGALAGGPIPSETERLEGFRRAGEAIMLALRTSQGVRLANFKNRYGVDLLEHYAPVVGRLPRRAFSNGAATFSG